MLPRLAALGFEGDLLGDSGFKGEPFAAVAPLRWSPDLGQVVKLGSPVRRTDSNDGQADAVFGGFQGKSGFGGVAG
jgi:hypothetical protein